MQLLKTALSEVIKAYRVVCARAKAADDGYIAQFLGDGILAYFGFPHAHENDAERAVRAGLDIVAAISRLEAFEPGQPKAWPPPPLFDPALFAPVPFDHRHSAEWWQVQEEEARAERERQEREATEREAKALENYHGPRWWERRHSILLGCP